jgi:hypothetical protein
MKVINRTIFKVLPGKMAEAMELEKKEMAIWRRLEASLPATKRYRLLTGGDDALHTVIVYQEWGSLAAWEAAAEKAMANPEMLALGPQWANLLADYRVEFYTEMPD